MEKRLAAIAPGASLTVLATDPMTKVDIPLHCRLNGYTCSFNEADGELRFIITRAA